MNDGNRRRRGRNRRLVRPIDIYLPPELWRDIFARLPTKTLMQFRCVCRNWCSLIDEPNFIPMHLNLYRNSDANTQLLTVEMVRSTSRFPLLMTISLRLNDTFRLRPRLFEPSEPYLSHLSSVSYSVHGLLLLLSDSGYLTLLNPWIRRSLTLPSCPLRLRYNYTSSYFLGYVQSGNDYNYKVVVFDCVDRNSFVLAIAVYRLRAGCWRERRTQVPEWVYNTCSQGDLACGSVYFQGAVYFRHLQSHSGCVDTQLVSFHFDSEQLRYMQLPVIEEGMNIFLFLFRGSLAVFGISRVSSCIWVLETDGENHQWWQHWHRANSLDARNLFDHILYVPIRVVYVERTSTLLVERGMEVTAYNIISIQTQRLSSRIPLRYIDTNYVESLVLHRGYDGVVSASSAQPRLQDKMDDTE